METIFKLLGRLLGRLVYFLRSQQLIGISLGVGIVILAVGFLVLKHQSQSYDKGSNSTKAPSTQTILCWKCGKDITNLQSIHSNDGYECTECYGKDVYQKRKQAENPQYTTDGEICRNCGTGKYVNGFCNLCGGASPEKVNQSQANAKACEFCGGSGFIKSSGIHEYNKVCPSCKGTGKQTY